MAETAALHPNQTIKTIKTISESPALTSIPSTHAFTPNPHDHVISESQQSLPIIDYSLLTSAAPHQRSQTIQELAKACQDWGFFMVVNHGVPERLMRSMIDSCKGFFDLTEEEKEEYRGKDVLDPIRCGTSFNASYFGILSQNSEDGKQMHHLLAFYLMISSHFPIFLQKNDSIPF